MPSPFFSRYIVDWLASQTLSRARQMVADEIKSRVESDNLGSYEGILFKDSFKGKTSKGVGRVDLGVVVSSKREVVGLLDKLGTVKTTKGADVNYYFSSWKGRSIAVAQTETGLDAARRGTEALLQAFRPSGIASIGFAVGLAPALNVLDVFMPDRLVDASGEIVDLRRRALPAPTNAAASGDGTLDETISGTALEWTSRFKTGALLSLDSGRPSPDQSAFASACDHSTLGVAEVCFKAGVPFLPLRVIYDFQDPKTSPVAAKVINSNQNFARSLGALMGAAFKKPSSIIDVCKVKERELEAADKLASAFARIIDSALPRDF